MVCPVDIRVGCLVLSDLLMDSQDGSVALHVWFEEQFRDAC
jgi:hypothetical protein